MNLQWLERVNKKNTQCNGDLRGKGGRNKDQGLSSRRLASWCHA